MDNIKYYISFVKACSLEIKEFETEQERTEFMVKFLFESQENPDNFVNFTFDGKITSKIL